ncbi:MAG: response regulator [Acidobacteriota bacterium]|nr:response regulator [Acidobacteriota bacterium]
MNRRILLADDSLTIQKVVELTFADTDFEVFAVSSGDELVAKLPEVKPDIVICDIIMPGRDGYDVCQEIKSTPEFLHLPVILLTGTFEPFDRDRALAVGCSEIITKPFEAKRLVEAVDKLASGAGSSHQATPAGSEPEVFDDGRVTPPPPIVAPDVLVDVEADYDLADTAITAESDTAEAVIEETGDGLDFTKSGFAEMETAGQQRAEQVFEAPTEGLDFELEGAGAEEIEAEADSVMETSPFRHEDIETIVTPDAAPDDPFSTTPVEDNPVLAEPADVEVFPTVEEPVFVEPDVAPDIDQNLTTPINVAEVMGSEEESSAVHDDPPDAPEALDEVDESNADTQDLGAPQQQQPAEVSEPSDASTGLSDDDIDRIAHRLLELAGDRIDRIAWEVLPDMAEIVVRERVREIEAEAERGSS